MTEAQQALTRQLRDSVLEKFQSIRRFCRLHHLRHATMNRYLAGKMEVWDEKLYDAISELVRTAQFNCNPEIVLLDVVIKKYCGGYEKFCKTAKIRLSTMAKILNEPFPLDSMEFKRLSWLAYSQALHQIENTAENPASKIPKKYLDMEHRRNRELQLLCNSDLKLYRRINK